MATILFDDKNCVGCAACAMACMDEHDLDLSVQHPYRSIFERETPQPDGSVRLTFLSESCRHCPGAPCAAACPAGCIRRDDALGLTVYDNARCTGCRACYAACPFGAPTFRRDTGKTPGDFRRHGVGLGFHRGAHAAPGGHHHHIHGCGGLHAPGHLAHGVAPGYGQRHAAAQHFMHPVRRRAAHLPQHLGLRVRVSGHHRHMGY